MTTVQQREQASDARWEPSLYYVYILRMDGGEFYVGQTNDLASRLAEHSIDAGAAATRGKRPELVWFSHTHDRDSAKQMEQRLQSALARSPLEIEQIVARFQDLLDLVRPQKTLRELEQEQREFDSEMAHSFHHVPLVIGRVKASCGWKGRDVDGWAVYGTNKWSELRAIQEEKEKVESVGVAYRPTGGRPPCRHCLALAPEGE